MNLELHVWRQAAPDAEGSFFTYHAKDVSPDMSFLRDDDQWRCAWADESDGDMSAAHAALRGR
jgi:succinate dehydrogenase / fumarate reductase iron-sulfur subunit